MITAWVALLGICFGSFINAFVWRLYERDFAKKKSFKDKDLSITKGRSMCVHCGHQLKSIDLIPILSWISVGGKCRYCKKKISAQYPLVELTTMLTFILSWIFWPYEFNLVGYLVFAVWLVCIVIFMALLVFDVRWMLLPNRLVFPLYGLAGVFVALRFIQESDPMILLNAVVGAAIGGGLFYVLFQMSDGAWIGGGDVKLGFALGALVGGPLNAFLLLFIASFLGSISALPQLTKSKSGAGSYRIPFGPFLIVAAIIVQLFGTVIFDWYTAQFL